MSIEKQNSLLKKMLLLVINILPNHSAGCYGLQVHPGNCNRCCDCDMDKLRKMAADLVAEDSKINLCDTCVLSFANCDVNPEFGNDEVRTDIVVKCDTYSKRE